MPLQEALLRAWRELARFEGRSSLRTWLYTVATRACLDLVATRGKRALPTDLGPSSERAVLDQVLRTDVAWLGPYPDSGLQTPTALRCGGSPVRPTVGTELDPGTATVATEPGTRHPLIFLFCLICRVIVRRQDQEHCASITCMIRHYVARRAQVSEAHPHNADVSAQQVTTGLLSAERAARCAIRGRRTQQRFHSKDAASHPAK
jgi:hypothetical protein